MSRRPKAHSHANHERWLISYADFITLLFAFFVVLYASAQTDNKRIARVSAAIQGGFQQLAAFTGGANGSTVLQPSQPGAALQPPQPSSVVDLAHGTGSGAGYSPDVNLLKRQLQEALGEEIQKHEVEMRVTPEGLVVSLREVGFFNTGDATLLVDGQNTLARIAGVLNAKGFHIRVEGHTDNKPIHNTRFKSNWELSTARATSVVALLIEKHGFDPTLVSAAGYSEYRPIASNDTEEGRRSNRRVDLVVVARSNRDARDSSGSPPGGEPKTQKE